MTMGIMAMMLMLFLMLMMMMMMMMMLMTLMLLVVVVVVVVVITNFQATPLSLDLLNSLKRICCFPTDYVLGTNYCACAFSFCTEVEVNPLVNFGYPFGRYAPYTLYRSFSH